MQGFEWDNTKREQNYHKHGIDFPDIIDVFKDPNAITRQDTRITHETRFQLIGKHPTEHVIIFIAWTKRDHRIRLISARMAHKKERVLYEKTH